MPDNVLSTATISGDIVGARGRAIASSDDFVRQDWEDGGIDINDPSEGLLYQAWEGVISGSDVIIRADNGNSATIHSAPDITEISFTFDHNMSPVLAFVASGIAYLKWFDSISGMDVITELTGASCPRVTHDDKRHTQSGASDVILVYKVGTSIYFRAQRDRYEIAYLLGTSTKRILRVGMNDKLRLQIGLV